MTYKDFKELYEQKGIELQDIASQIGMTSNGLRESVRKGTLESKRLKKLCEIMRITPNEFFSQKSVIQNVTTNNGQITGIDNRQYYSDNLDVLRAQIELLEERIKEKDKQLKEKDNQIKELLGVLKKLK